VCQPGTLADKNDWPDLHLKNAYQPVHHIVGDHRPISDIDISRQVFLHQRSTRGLALVLYLLIQFIIEQGAKRSGAAMVFRMW
jgi:hypothetical protein